ncbi:aminotransferase class I/II-fold pyridoxal phosphate-dependent enzyme [Desulforhopalus singaporensis]|uniref:8-amino-7-oxononanoate synthase n=1 Tax=Desulforhopalus singaporensis TaxID=91360 RepID=A0A1H0VEQ3_9BACT|nr:8-amino-7-oxononanoate synthase [Desulforhopalus singaporensis]SDP76698.1 8-amino-7-oxononanoate synthase [Desulforhopalus singaporensis]
MTLRFANLLSELKRTDSFRELHPLSGRKGCRITYNGRELLNLTSNDYLGIGSDSELHQRFFSTITRDEIPDTFGLGSTSSRLLCGDRRIFHELEHTIARRYGFPACLFYNSGYHANIGILPSLLTRKDLILSDKLNHASIHDGIRLARADCKRFRHCDYEHLEQLLTKHRGGYENAVIVTESVFSMDGDVADLQRLVRLKEKFDCTLYLDEAHAIGLYGPGALGQAEQQDVLHHIDLLVAPFGKAPGSMGALVLCTKEIRQVLINKSRALIFTTALPPIVASWNLFVFNHMLTLQKKRDHLNHISTLLRNDLRNHGLKTKGTTNIVPVVIGDNLLTVTAARRMQELGYYILPVRPPTVPKGSSRFRLSLTADMQENDIRGIAPCLAMIINGQTTKPQEQTVP